MSTGLQASLLMVVRALEGYRETASPREYLVTLDLIAAWILREQARLELVRRRWAT